ncbi:MAG TPA: GNAT family N-acetyltransferase [Pyrinomonadaceae bacterium]|nr:GNAT family N-acetyltransferase [Pyrinomonadaceae bacterium]HNU08135.1 GNAT family N-acetyltransferase [Pyrinomonadaceae bacterium]
MTANNLSVRPLVESDLAEWFRLRCLLWDELSEDDHKSEMLGIYEHPDTQLVVVADVDGRLAGFLEASIRPFVEDCETDHVGYLEGWFVESDYRMHGVGRELVRAAENWARRKGCTEMASDSEIGNELSLEAHLKLGYEVTSRLVHLRKELE